MINEEQVKEYFAEKLAELRKNKGMTQLQLAESLNYSNKAVSKWERGESIPDAYTLLKISKLFSVPVDALVNKDFKYTEAVDGGEFSASSHPKRVFIPIISALGAYFVASLIFFVMKNIPFLQAYAPFVFMFATVAACIVLTGFSAIGWRGVHQCGCVSGIIWSVGLCIALPAGAANFKYILVPCAILNAYAFWFICLYIFLKRAKRLRNNGKLSHSYLTDATVS